MTWTKFEQNDTFLVKDLKNLSDKDLNGALYQDYLLLLTETNAWINSENGRLSCWNIRIHFLNHFLTRNRHQLLDSF